MDIQRYLDRISYHGFVTPTATTLCKLHLAHLQSVPFENLDIHLGHPILLKLDALFEKIVRRRRGGFCYELNGLFAWLLQELGFQVTLLSACAAHSDGGYGPEFDHLTLLVECPADPSMSTIPWLADVGWGDSFCEPLRLDQPNVKQPEGLRAYRIDQDDRYFILWQRTYEGDWEKQFRFTLQPRQFADFESMCGYHQTSPESSFTQRRICTVATPNGRVSLANHKLIVTENGQRQERAVRDDEYPLILAERFGVVLYSTVSN
ncbi:arylamine N-acetyltransferase [Chloroflexi bacterium TSY]|nr:arylamine N-acetyltransferase [Chloroflexi bacterium TSY]